MKHRVILFLLLMIAGFSPEAQSLEEEVTIYLESFLEDNKSFVTSNDLVETHWMTKDLMGSKTLNFDSKGRFKSKSYGFQASSTSLKGKWYINNEFIVLKVKKEKKPIYVLKNDEQLILVDDDQIDVLKQLLTEASYKDGELKPYTYSEIYTFLNGFTIQR
ncbi:MAG: hypothetical protein ABJF04_07440 [Reichenbachiella sp.]|uniref:hypothetical protein n=1 Tax=Reichenbachiella sp. TaxID=2184521 RepID=UPI003265C3C5